MQPSSATGKSPRCMKRIRSLTEWLRLSATVATRSIKRCIPTVFSCSLERLNCDSSLCASGITVLPMTATIVSASCPVDSKAARSIPADTGWACAMISSMAVPIWVISGVTPTEPIMVGSTISTAVEPKNEASLFLAMRKNLTTPELRFS